MLGREGDEPRRVAAGRDDGHGRRRVQHERELRTDSERRAAHQAATDSITGLANRKDFADGVDDHVGAVEVEVGFGVAGDGEPVGGSEVVGLAAVTRS